MTNWIDSHFHPQYDSLGLESIQEAIDGNIIKLACVATKLTDEEFLLNLLKKFPEVKISLGEHPLNDFSLNINWEILERNLNNIHAIGETGFDFQGKLEEQLKAFDIQASFALQYNLPLILHIRDSGDGIVEEFAMNAIKKHKNLRAIFHCFTGSQKLAEFAAHHGIFVSFSGIITFKNTQNLLEIMKKLPHELLLIETDSPFLAPKPMRGKNNRPLYVKYIGEFMANILDMPFENLSKILLNNFDKVFK